MQFYEGNCLQEPNSSKKIITCVFPSYSETCLNWTSLGQTFVFRIDRCLQRLPTLEIYLKFGLYRILVYSGFGFDRFHNIYNLQQLV